MLAIKLLYSVRRSPLELTINWFVIVSFQWLWVFGRWTRRIAVVFKVSPCRGRFVVVAYADAVGGVWCGCGRRRLIVLSVSLGGWNRAFRLIVVGLILFYNEDQVWNVIASFCVVNVTRWLCWCGSCCGVARMFVADAVAVGRRYDCWE